MKRAIFFVVVRSHTAKCWSIFVVALFYPQKQNQSRRGIQAFWLNYVSQKASCAVPLGRTWPPAPTLPPAHFITAPNMSIHHFRNSAAARAGRRRDIRRRNR
jgi:hypothetical protein